MHARTVDLLQIGDRARQFGLERMLIARAFHELADAKTGLLRHHRETAVAFGQTLPGQLQPRIVYALGRHGDLTRGAIELVGDAVLFERLRNLRRILLTQVAVQQRIRRLLRPQHDTDTGCHRCGNAEQQHERPKLRRNQGGARQRGGSGAHGCDSVATGNRQQATTNGSPARTGDSQNALRAGADLIEALLM